MKYIELVALLRATPVLAYLQPSRQISVPLPTLPMRVHEFLKDCFDLPDETAKLAWEFLLGFEPSAEEQSAHRIKHVKLFLEYGLSREIGPFFRSNCV